jgi:hypothetical protein
MDGTDRQLVATNAREPCWKEDSTVLAYLKGEVEQFTFTDYATKGTFFHDLASGRHTQHPNKELMHLYNPCWTPDGKWCVAIPYAGRRGTAECGLRRPEPSDGGGLCDAGKAADDAGIIPEVCGEPMMKKEASGLGQAASQYQQIQGNCFRDTPHDFAPLCRNSYRPLKSH